LKLTPWQLVSSTFESVVALLNNIGGGSILSYKNGLFLAGPESASAHPGPVAYRKGGPLTVTDANLVLGRIQANHFPKIFGKNENESLDYEGSRKAFEKLLLQVNKDLQTTAGKSKIIEELALGFLEVANETMCRPIRGLTEAKGYRTADHDLAVFGGAGGQHACVSNKVVVVVAECANKILGDRGKSSDQACPDSSLFFHSFSLRHGSGRSGAGASRALLHGLKFVSGGA
jgi:hypothetical protein